MIKTEVYDFKTKQKYPVSFFEDDTIDIVRQQIGKSMDIHPDRLFILVGIEVSPDYYKKDPRRWEALFIRMSYNGQPIDKELLQEYNTNYRKPEISIPYDVYNRTDWMGYPDALSEIYADTNPIREHRILGVEESKSYILPFKITSPLVSRIPSARLPIPEISSLFSSLHDVQSLKGFLVFPYEESYESVSSVYFPFLRNTSPPRLTEESITIINKNAKLLGDLLSLNVNEPKKVSIIRTRFHVPFVETDFGNAIRTRFEQIFYGLTVCKENPYIGYFTSKNETTRHKFYAEDSKDKKPYVDMSMWNSWWSTTKPARNRPTLVLYRGKSKYNFDRIAITSIDIVLSTYRDDQNKQTIDELKEELNEWLQTLDAILPFLYKEDIEFQRWDLQDLSFLAHYANKLDEFDLRRFNCISNIFNISDKSKTTFSLLRTDHTNDGISALDIKLLQLLRDTPLIKANQIGEELSISKEEASRLLVDIEDRIAEDPKLPERAFRGFPNLRVGADTILMSSINNLQRSLKYANILRFVLSETESKELDKICPKRLESISPESAIIASDTLDVDAAISEEYNDLFGYLEEGDLKNPVDEEPEEIVDEKISVDEKPTTTYSNLYDRLQQFDPVTFNKKGSVYPKKCEQKHQPIILSQKELDSLKDGPYDINKTLTEDQKIPIENPDGTIICPEYWCMKDSIPLSEKQLIREEGIIKCPVCKGKLSTQSNDSIKEYPLRKRESGFYFPGFGSYKSPTNGKPMPCCFKRSKLKKIEKVDKDIEDKYYILGTTKLDINPFRIAFLSEDLIKSLYINETYSFLGGGRRIQSGMSGFFRVGMGRPSETLPALLDIKTKISEPKDSISTVLKCSFLSSWRTTHDKDISEIDSSLKQISLFEKDDQARESIKYIISGIQEAYVNNQLSILEELEYVSIFLQTDVFRIMIDDVSMSCMFYTQMSKPRSRGIIILQSNSYIDILSHVTRLPRTFEYRSNIFEIPFKKETYVEVEKLRNAVCKTNIPSYNDALGLMKELLIKTDSTDYLVVLDPYARGQSFYIKNKLILPFLSTPLPNVGQAKLSSYSEIQKEDLPTGDAIEEILLIASKQHSGYTFKEYLHNSQNQKTEILTESGLRIPIQPIDSIKAEPEEVIETVQSRTETELTFGDPSDEMINIHKNISYFEEVFEFMLFQLTSDIQIDYLELRNILQEANPSIKLLQPLLQKWFDETTQFIDIKNSDQFISKIRTPCGQFKNEKSCKGNLCGWDGKTCRIQIKKNLSSDALFHRILYSLVDNFKTRSMVLDGRITPFFSTILYIELPHELILTDNELN